MDGFIHTLQHPLLISSPILFYMKVTLKYIWVCVKVNLTKTRNLQSGLDDKDDFMLFGVLIVVMNFSLKWIINKMDVSDSDL